MNEINKIGVQNVKDLVNLNLINLFTLICNKKKKIIIQLVKQICKN